MTARDAGIARNTVFALLTQIATAVFAAGLTLYLVRALGPRQYGVFALTVGIGGILLLPSDFGISNSAARFIAEKRETPLQIAAILRHALGLKLISASGISVSLFVLAPVIAASFHEPSLESPMRLMAVTLFFQTLLTLYITVFAALRNVALNLWVILCEGGLELLMSVTFVALGAGALGAVGGRACAYFGAVVLALSLTARLIGKEVIKPRRSPDRGQGVLRYAGALFIVDGAFTIFSNLDILLIGAFLGSPAVAIFAAPLRISNLLHYPGLALSKSVSPRVTQSDAGSTDARSFLVALRWLIVLQAAIVVPLVIWADPIVELALGPGYEKAADVIRALSPYIFLQGIGPLVSVSVNYLGQARRRVPVAIGAVLVNAVIDVILIPRIGVVGAAIGTSVAYSIYVPWHFVLCRQALGLSVARLGLTCLRVLCAGIFMAVVLLLIGGTLQQPLTMTLAGVCGCVVFLAALIATGEVKTTELRRAIGQLA